MERMKPYAGKSFDRLVAMINKDNSKTYVYGVDFTFDTPVAEQFKPAVISNGFPGSYNTRVLLHPGSSPRKLKDQVVRFNRLNLGVLGNLPAGWIQDIKVDQVPFTVNGVLPAINEALGLDLIEGEIKNVQFTKFDKSITLEIDESVSYAWLGNFTFKIAISLDLMLANNRLGIYDFLNPPSYVDGDIPTHFKDFLGRLHAENPYVPALKESEITVSNPVEIPTAGNSFENTSVTITAVEGQGYYGVREILYHRLTMQEYIGNDCLVSEDPITVKMVIDFLNAKRGINLRESDLEPINVPLLTTAGEIGTVQLSALNNSYAWSGEAGLDLLFGVPNDSRLHDLMNHVLPSSGYLT